MKLLATLLVAGALSTSQAALEPMTFPALCTYDKAELFVYLADNGFKDIRREPNFISLDGLEFNLHSAVDENGLRVFFLTSDFSDAGCVMFLQAE